MKAHTDTYAAPFKYIFQFGSFTTASYDNGRFGWVQPPVFPKYLKIYLLCSALGFDPCFYCDRPPLHGLLRGRERQSLFSGFKRASNRPLYLSSIVPSGTWNIDVEMVGQPLIINRMSNAVTLIH